MALASLKAMLAGAVRDRMSAIVALAVAGFLFLTSWVLAVAALVAYVSAYLGTIRALLAIAGGLIILALLIVWFTTARNRRTAEMRKSTRALWAATAVNAASAILRSEPKAQDGGAEQASGSHRSTLLIVGGLALMLLALLVPGGRDTGPERPAPGPDDGA